MDNGESEIVELGTALTQNWQIAATGNDNSSYDEFLRALTQRIRHLLEHNPDRLLTALYILDVPEEGFREATTGKSIEKSADALARIVIEREMKRVETRRKYSRQPATNPDQLA